MINSGEFADRLKRIMSFYQLSSSAFADRIQVQRSSISHLLSGRNKPSLDFVLKVVQEFKEVELYWLLNGKGTFPSTSADIEKSASTQSLPQSEIETPQLAETPITSIDKKAIDRIVIFFRDGSFQEYLP